MGNKSLNTFKYSITIFLSIILLIGISYCLVSFFVDKELIYIDSEIAISDIITINVTLILAIIVPITLGLSLENKKISKELLIKLSDKVLVELVPFRQLISGIKVDISGTEKEDLKDAILEQTGYIGTNIQKLKIALSSEFPTLDFTNIDNALDNLKSSTSDDLRNRDFDFSVSYKSDVKKRIREIDDLLENLKFQINDQ